MAYVKMHENSIAFAFVFLYCAVSASVVSAALKELKYPVGGTVSPKRGCVKCGAYNNARRRTHTPGRDHRWTLLGRLRDGRAEIRSPHPPDLRGCGA